MMPLISIVVPVFNVERYVGACLDSLRKQTVSAIEIICVDDASTDGSAVLLAAAARADARVVTLKHESNRGLSATRNTGVRAAHAPWILFVDSDDLVSCHLCERVLAAAERLVSDAVFFGYAVFRDGQTPPPEPAAGVAVVADRASLLRRQAFAWTKLVRRDLMRSKGIEFPEGLCFEDIPVHWRLVLESERPAFLNEPLVWYRQRRGSISYRTDWSFADVILTHDLTRDYLRETGRWEQWKEIFLVQQLTAFVQIHAHYTVANPLLAERVNEELRARLTPEHWNVLQQESGIPGWKRDYLIACGRPTGGRTGPKLLLPILRHRLRYPLRCLWHRFRLVLNGAASR
jgi:glycosyltransferase involved in cell wall biosynthesis